MNTSSKAQAHSWICNILLIAKDRHLLRVRPGITSAVKERAYERHDQSIRIVFEELDKLEVPWSVQNRALDFINDIDQRKVIDCLYRNSFEKLAEQILAGINPLKSTAQEA